jgi:hypothetical protein
VQVELAVGGAEDLEVDFDVGLIGRWRLSEIGKVEDLDVPELGVRWLGGGA